MTTADKQQVLDVISTAMKQASLPRSNLRTGTVSVTIGTGHLAEPVLDALRKMPRDVLLRALGMQEITMPEMNAPVWIKP